MTTTKKLSSIDFMMMDVHEPLTNEDIAQINPQAAVDKTIGAVEDGEREEESVDSPQPRCPICFGPKPCGKHDNVEPLQGVTSLDIDPTAILAGAHEADLEVVVVVGIRKDGREYFATSCADAAEGMYHCQRGIYKLNKVVDEGADDD